MPKFLKPLATWVYANQLLTIVLVAYVFVSVLAFEQGRTIENQKSLIRQLFSDSLELHNVKVQQLSQAHQRH